MTRARFDVPLAVAVALVLLSQASARVGAAPRANEGLARQHFQQGEDLYVREQYADALLEFEAGYAALPLPGFLINIGQCRRRLGDLGEARVSYEKFLQRAPNSPLAPTVRTLIRELLLTPPPLEVPDIVTTKVDTTKVEPAKVEPASPMAVAAPRAKEASAADPPVALRATQDPIAPLALGAPLRVAADPPLSGRSRSARSMRLWWILGSVALTTLTVSALVIGNSGSPTTIHDGTLGTLRR